MQFEAELHSPSYSCSPVSAATEDLASEALKAHRFLRAHQQRLLFSQPASLTLFNRNLLLCWNRNFSRCGTSAPTRLTRETLKLMISAGGQS
jgi:hypothetical protein